MPITATPTRLQGTAASIATATFFANNIKPEYVSSSRLKTDREEGAGLGQITRAYNKDGSLRFDKVSELRSQYKQQLKEMSWKNIYTRPDLQIRSIVLMIRDDYRRFNTIDRKSVV